MSARRRKAGEIENIVTEPDAKRRVTRSSLRRAVEDGEDAKDHTKKSVVKNNTKVEKSSKRTSPTSNSKHNASDTATAESDLTAKHHLSTISIESTSVKSPISCHVYSSPSAQFAPASQSPSAPLVFTHGAGGTLSAPAVVNFCTGFSELSSVLAFQGSMNLASRVKGFHVCLEHLQDQETEKEISKSLLLGGRSMGARAAVMAASEFLASTTKPQAASTPKEILLILVSYPLKGPKDIRSQILTDLPKHVQVLFVIGERDNMCPLDLLEKARKDMQAPNWLLVVQGMNHGMHGKNEKELGERSGRIAASWVQGERWGKEAKVLEPET